MKLHSLKEDMKFLTVNDKGKPEFWLEQENIWPVPPYMLLYDHQDLCVLFPYSYVSTLGLLTCIQTLLSLKPEKF